MPRSADLSMQRISDLERQYVLEALGNEFRASTNGRFRARLEAAFCQTFQSPYAIALNSGTAALHVALAALDVAAGHEIIVPPLTMASTSICALQCGAVPVFADVDRETFTLDAGAAAACVSERTRAMIPVSLYGLPADYDALSALCRTAGLAMVEDNAQAFLSRYKGRVVGSFGDFACYSFQASKHMTCGDGGMLTARSQEHADRARQFSTLGYAAVSATRGAIDRRQIQDPAFSRHASVGYNYRLGELNAAVALGQLERLDELVAHRVRVASLYRQAIDEFDFLVPQRIPDGAVHSYWAYTIVLATERPEVDWYEFRDLFVRNGGEGYYAAWELTYREPMMRDYKAANRTVRQSYEAGLCPNAEYLQPRLLQLQTNHWDLDHAARQADSLHATAREFGA